MSFLERMLLSRVTLPLDDPRLQAFSLTPSDIEVEEVRIPKADTSKLRPHDTLWWLSGVVLTSLELDAVALRLFVDVEDVSLRMMICCPQTRKAIIHNWTEFMPMEPTFTNTAMVHLRRIMRLGRRRSTGCLRYVYKGSCRTAAVVEQKANDIVIYFGTLRPPVVE